MCHSCNLAWVAVKEWNLDDYNKGNLIIYYIPLVIWLKLGSLNTSQQPCQVLQIKSFKLWHAGGTFFLGLGFRGLGCWAH